MRLALKGVANVYLEVSAERESNAEKVKTLGLDVLLQLVERHEPVQVLDDAVAFCDGCDLVAPQNRPHALLLENGANLR